MLQNGVGGNLVEHALQRRASRLNKVGLEAADGLLLWRRWNDDAGVVAVQLRVEPEEVAVAAGDGELGRPVALGGGFCGHGVLGVGAGEVADLVGVADGDGERGLGRLGDAHAGLRLARRSSTGRHRHRRGDPGRLGTEWFVGSVVEVDRVHQTAERCGDRALGKGFFVWRRGRS